jgi:hypothetical protein
MRKFIYFPIAVSDCLNKTHAGKLRLLDSESFSSSFRESRTTAHAFFVRVLLCGFFEAACCFACALHKHQRVSYPPSTTVRFSDESCSILSTQKHAKNSRLVKKSLEKNFPATESRAENATRKISKKFCCAHKHENTAQNPKQILQQLPLCAGSSEQRTPADETEFLGPQPGNGPPRGHGGVTLQCAALESDAARKRHTTRASTEDSALARK